MFLYAATIFVSAFLLFQLQPMAARFVLPWFGGSSMVWTTCMLFFQTVLVLGYAWSHGITRRLSVRWQVGVQLAVLALALVTLPIRPDENSKPVDGLYPTWRLLWLLGITVGLPFFLTSTTGPLIQYWQSVTHPTRSPFRLFALSNAASLLALLAYPLLVEWWLPLDGQSWYWSGGFCLYGGLLALSCVQLWRRSGTGDTTPWHRESQHAALKVPPSWFALGIWLILPMLASVVLLATTHVMTQEIGAIPFLWVLPLGLYLLSFVVCFDHSRWYLRILFFPLFFGATIFSAIVLKVGVEAPIAVQVVSYSVLVFGASMCCHGELARVKPSPRHLTLFYLLIAIGGALGGVVTAIIAPAVFTDYFEFPLAIVVAVVATLMVYGVEVRSAMLNPIPGDARTRKDSGRAVLRDFNNSLWVFCLLLIVGLLAAMVSGLNLRTMVAKTLEEETIFQGRNEYGTLRVSQFEHVRQLTNGRIQHGLQYLDERWAQDQTSYYCPTSGLGQAILWLRMEAAFGRGEQALSYGAIGLGVGTICSWCEEHDRICYYEINPLVVDVAETYFTYLEGYRERTGREPVIRLGDARIQMERELKSGDFQRYDVIIADAFTSDSIPVHLLTRESMELYAERLTERGILCVHTSNRFMELENIVRNNAEHLGLEAVFVEDEPEMNGCSESSWVLVTRDRRFVNTMRDEGLATDWPKGRASVDWTDDFAPILPIVRWDSESDWWTDFLFDIGWLKKEDEAE